MALCNCPVKQSLDSIVFKLLVTFLLVKIPGSRVVRAQLLKLQCLVTLGKLFICLSFLICKMQIILILL